jgi:arylsulfatase A-like enzyme/Tfp pilus assembly protein PilF
VAGVSGCRATPPPDPAPAHTSILLITLDTVRADRIGRGFTPGLDAIAARGLRFTNARSVAPLTLPAHASILTGQWPPAHGLRLNGTARLEAVATLATRLRDAGYQTRAVVGAFVLDRRFGLDAGFDEYNDRIARDPRATDVLQAERPAAQVGDTAIALLERTRTDTPWLLWVHFYDAHAPYAPPADALQRAGGDPYNGEIAYVDAQVSRLLSTLDRRADAARTAVIVVGDHGESLGAHGEPTHGMLVTEPALRVPLLVRAPGVAPAERADAASLVDIAPTVLALAGVDRGVDADGSPGRSLLAPPATDLESYAESEYPTVAGWTPVRALIRDRWKLVVATSPALFDLSTDPGELIDVAATKVPMVTAMMARLSEVRQRPAPTGRASGAPLVSAETAARLRSLGYVAPSAAPPVETGGVDAATAIEAWAAYETALADIGAGRVARALPVLSRLVARYPGSPIFASTQARALASTGRPSEALTRFRAAVKHWPGDWSLYHELAVVARDLGLVEEALRAEDAALALAPDEPSALNGRGLLLADAGRHDEAVRAFEHATREDPTNGVYFANLGNARRALGQLDGAAAAFKQAIDRAPDLGDAANGLGVVLVQQQRPAEAVPWLERAARDPAFVEAQLNLGIALQESGNRQGAVSQYRKVLSAPGPHQRERDAARALLSQLEKR